MSPRRGSSCSLCGDEHAGDLSGKWGDFDILILMFDSSCPPPFQKRISSTYSEEDGEFITIKVIMGDEQETSIKVRREEDVQEALAKRPELDLGGVPDIMVLFGEEPIESGSSFSDYGIESGARLVIPDRNDSLGYWQKTFDTFDRDGDGVLSSEELSHFVAYNFSKKVDMVSESQLSNTLAQLDADGDGKVSKADLLSILTNGKGSHSEQDVEVAKAAYISARQYATAAFA